MSLNVTFNGSMYIIPETGEVGWGGNTTSYLVAIAAGALQKTGGSFLLSAETDFGGAFGLKALYYKSRSANIAAAGILRLSNSDTINWRNFANSADLPLSIDSSDRLLYNGVIVLTGTSPSAYVSSITGTTNQVIASSPTGAVTLSLPQSINTTANVQFGTLGLGSSIVASSILSLSSTTLGFLPPRVTTVERDAIVSPATGLFVYNTTTGVYNFYNGSVWTAIAAGGTVNPGNAGFFPYYPATGSTLDDQTVMSTNGTTQVYFIDGTLAVPSLSWASDPDTGFRRQGSGIVDFSSNGVNSFTMTPQGIQIGDGTPSLPSLVFINDFDTGLYRTGTNSLGVALGGVKNLDMTSSVSTIQSSLTFGTAEVSGFSGTPTTGGTVPANTYYYKVFALNANGYIGIPSDEIVVVVGGANNKVDLSWTTVTDAVSYRIQRGTDQGGGAGYWVTSGITFSDSGQAFDFPGQGAVQAVNQFKVELPGTVDLTASQGAIRWRDYIDSSLVTGSIACTSAGEMEFVASQGVVSGMFLFSKYGTASPFNIDLRFTNPRVAFNSAIGEIAAGGVVGAYFYAAGTPTGMQTPNGLGISDGTVSLPGLYFINDTDTGFYRSAPNQILVSLGGIQSLLFDTGKVQGLVATASSPTFSWIADPNSGMYAVGADDIGFATNGILRLDINTSNITSTLSFLTPDGSVALPSYSWTSDTDSGLYRAGTNSIGLATNGIRALLIDSSQAVAIRGTSTNDNPTAGDVGEYIESVVSVLANYPAASGNLGDATSISLPAGDWDVSFTFLANEAGGSLTTQADVGISTTSGNSATGLVLGSNRFRVTDATSIAGNSCSVPVYRMSLPATTTVYGKLLGVYTVATPQYRCRLSARRVR